MVFPAAVNSEGIRNGCLPVGKNRWFDAKWKGIIAGCSGPNNQAKETSMRNLIFSALLLTSATLLTPAQSAYASGDAESGKVKAYTCTGCHGIPGYKNVYPTYKVPKIGGQNYEYLVIALKAYKAGERDHPTMRLQSQALSDQDIEDISAYFASLGGESS
jgi:cytochrome c553